MSKLTITEAVKVIPVSESTLRSDLKSGKVSFDTDTKDRKQIDVSELTRVYGQLKQSNGTQPPASGTGEHAEPVNNTHQTSSMNGNDNPESCRFTREPSRRSQSAARTGIRSGDRAHHREVQTPRFNRQTPETERSSHAPSSEAKERMVATLDRQIATESGLQFFISVLYCT